MLPSGFLGYGTNSFKNMGGNINDAAGNICRAVLFVRRFEAGNAKKTKQEDRYKKSDELQKKLVGNFLDDKSPDRILGAANEKLNGTSSLSNLSFSELSKIAEGTDYLAMEVQYNPATISFKSTTGGERKSYREGLGGLDNNMITQAKTFSTTIMTVKLIFEAVNVNDAFINTSESFINGSIGNVISTGADVGKKLFTDDPSEAYTIRPYVEGLLSLLMAEQTRDVIFYWGKSCFHGELINVTANYSMFNKQGNPIFGDVTLTIRQNDKSAFDILRWRKAYEKQFGKDGEEAEDDRSTMDKMEGLDDWLRSGIF